LSEHPSVGLIRELYEARARNDVAAIRSILDENVVWHEPELEAEHTGDLRGSEAVLAMIGEARRITDGTFSLVPQQIVANGEHAVALIDWSATRGGGERLEGKEVAVYRVRNGKIVEASFHQDNPDTDRKFWE
jgi:ketosteroid isomerase-like protein